MIFYRNQILAPFMINSERQEFKAEEEVAAVSKISKIFSLMVSINNQYNKYLH